ncbi:Rv3654c family TadE-like protein [Arthrobacter sp. M4]|uniref:Rv3654c family TadE-like protein n=1 Tax=Arthrobacter sp. M4 TaxID=218160 RepID=UPI001CDCB607|nr:Rv3654c family TadE-like protein [Arthrobacter sp. M4]MCA4135060.1 flp pilus-assembly TadE/G-like family protein [Arthrobacter sp. M4]
MSTIQRCRPCSGPSRCHSGGEGERGSGTILAAALGVLLVVIMAGLVLLARASAHASRAATAADMSALAAADAARGLTSGDPCTVAAETAARHHALLKSCEITGGDTVQVATELEVSTLAGPGTGRARAGPPP